MDETMDKAAKIQTKVAIIFHKLGYLNEVSHRVKSLSSAVKDKLLGPPPADEAKPEDKPEPTGILENIAEGIQINIDILGDTERTLSETNKQLNKN